MSLRAEDITIAVTLYDRKKFLAQSVGSALGQTVPVRVMVIEDCGPDPALQDFVRQQFGERVQYIRNPRRRGIFGNWNACIENCQTPWLSILHDDDVLKPDFVEAMIELSGWAGEKGLYYGRETVVDAQDQTHAEWEKPPLPGPWRAIALRDAILYPPFGFPGQLFRVAAARALGGFRETSLFCGDWELWTKIIARYGAAQTARMLAIYRDHAGLERGTSRIHRSGKMHALIAVQRKRNLALARGQGLNIAGSEKWGGVRTGVSAWFLLRNAQYFSSYYLSYYVGLVRGIRPPHWRSALFRVAVRAGGVHGLHLASRVWNQAHRSS